MLKKLKAIVLVILEKHNRPEGYSGQPVLAIFDRTFS